MSTLITLRIELEKMILASLIFMGKKKPISKNEIIEVYVTNPVRLLYMVCTNYRKALRSNVRGPWYIEQTHREHSKR